MSFRGIFVAVFIGTALIIGAYLLHSQRPATETDQPSPELVKATGKCASCHRRQTGAIVHQFEKSQHAEAGITCLDCHQPQEGQPDLDHRGFVISADMTSKNCQQCHSTEYDQFLRSRHAAPAYAAVAGSTAFTEEQIEQAEKYHPGTVRRTANKLAQLEGEAAITSGCAKCHSIGKPNIDGSIGTCTDCHSRHQASLSLARQPRTCGQCHMGPDHAQLEIFRESKHGVIFNDQKEHMNLSADPQELTTDDMPVPTCSTCHMSGLEGAQVTHNVSARLSYWLFQPVSEKRPGYYENQARMKEICTKCHAASSIDTFYAEAEAVLTATNEKVESSQEIMQSLREDGLLTPQPFDEPIEFLAFDYWHYYGRTAKHGAFMGGADYVQWHGNYELLAKLVEMREQAAEIRENAHN